MSKFKKKYKWRERERHFWELKASAALEKRNIECAEKIAEMLSYHWVKDHNFSDKTEFYKNGLQWSEEDLSVIKEERRCLDFL